MTLHLVRHGRPAMTRGVPAAEWDLDAGAYDDVWALRASGRLPARAAWFTSPEPKAVQTAQLLTDAQVGVLPQLREHERTGSGSRTSRPRCVARLPGPTCRPSPGGSR
ncbi:hypothetical protein [Nocardioides sp. S5]|uniref:hypothetical protein n=1 Tax=Nocardioides sp. S5 TaxID=2017486 RepID=UPI001A8D661F|nr:hypothetical protein [Nocardioides sp. S5]